MGNTALSLGNRRLHVSDWVIGDCPAMQIGAFPRLWFSCILPASNVDQITRALIYLGVAFVCHYFHNCAILRRSFMHRGILQHIATQLTKEEWQPWQGVLQ
jgi:hypothetical protein